VRGLVVSEAVPNSERRGPLFCQPQIPFVLPASLEGLRADNFSEIVPLSWRSWAAACDGFSVC
jgi:hypothetical protein